PPTSVATLKAAHFVVRSTPSFNFDDFIINSNPKQDPSHRELLNPLLRQAFDYAIDRQAIVKTSLPGYGQPGSSITRPAPPPRPPHGPRVRPVDQATAVRPGEGEPAARPGRLQDGAERAAGRERPPDVVHRDHSVRSGELLHAAVLPDRPGGFQEDRRQADGED